MPMGDLSKFEDVAKTARKLPPVDRWNPDYTGDLDMRIAADGSWFYQGTPILRERMVRLFSTILRKDDDGRTYMVTPQEKYGITVDDAPFTVVEMHVEDPGANQTLNLRTNLDEQVTVNADHPIRFQQTDTEGGIKPYVLVRGNLEALMNRAIFYELVEIGVVEAHEGADWFGIWSSGTFWPMALADEIGAER